MRQDETVNEVRRLRSENNIKSLQDAVCSLTGENQRLRDHLRRLIDNVETGSYESTGQCIDECKRILVDDVGA